MASSFPDLQLPLSASTRQARLAAVDDAQEAVPANADDVDRQDAVLERHKGEVDTLHERPDHPVGLQGGPPGLVDLFLCRHALHGGHRAEEDLDHDGREEELVRGHAGGDLCRLVLEHDLAGQEAEPGCRNRAEDH